MYMKNKVLFISDDIRGTSGVSHISKTIVAQTADMFDWVQLSAMKEHPEKNSVVDVSNSVTELTGYQNCYVRLYPISGYGDEITLRNLIALESPDAILHMSDPRNFKWLYEMDMELRDNTPLCYYHVWDNDPIPTYNTALYESCDWIGCINKKTHEYVKQLAPNTTSEYIPHGISPDMFYNITNEDEISHLRDMILGTECVYDFVVFCNNVNTPRKRLADLLLSMETFASCHSDKKICLLCHINPNSVPIYNLRKLAEEMCPSVEILFTNKSVSHDDINKLYNIADITVNIASNEGFGLSTLESLMTETPILATDTGGLSDQMYGDDSVVGEWAYAIQPDVRRMNGNADVLYIYEDLCSINSIVSGLNYWFGKSKEELLNAGRLGRENAIKKFNSVDMINSIKHGITSAIESHDQHSMSKIVKL